ncbi:bridging integrator 3, partial [Pipra filicauda]|uniref:Bridging integrator 3 n=2 Tax=Pipridae TaxID=114313 RepID=A0A7R5KUH9_9PASS
SSSCAGAHPRSELARLVAVTLLQESLELKNPQTPFPFGAITRYNCSLCFPGFRPAFPRDRFPCKGLPLQAPLQSLGANFHLFFPQVERDFEREYGKLQQLEDQTKKLQKDMKKSTDADLAMSKSAVKISSDLLSNPLCEQEPAFLEMVTAFDTAMKRMDSFNQEKVNQIQKTVIEPLKKFSSVFPSLNMAVKRREQTLQDYKRLQSKVEKYEEKERTGPVLAKLHQAREELRPVKEDFEAKNKQLLEEMPKFYSSRIDYFKPSFESLVRAQVVYYTEMHKIFGDLTAQIDRPGLSDEQRERENDAKLSELRALSIVADD